MDSLLYVGAAEGSEDDDDEVEGEDDQDESADAPTHDARSKNAKPALSFEAIQRAGYSGSSADLTKTGTYLRLEEEATTARQRKEAELQAAKEVEQERHKALEAEERRIKSRKEIDEQVGYEKRFDRTQENFRNKEKRKRAMGQQNRDGNWVEEEKRKLRHGMTGNYDS